LLNSKKKIFYCFVTALEFIINLESTS